MRAKSDISVIIPTYNRASWVLKAVDSILDQTEPPLEVIVVDDGSTDHTAQVIEGYSDRGVRLHQQENRGVSAARNVGAELARGEFLAFLDSDDVAYPKRLEVQRAFHEEYPGFRWSFTNFQMIDHLDRPLPGKVGFPSAFPLFDDSGMEPAEFFRSFLGLRERGEILGGEHHQFFVGDFFPALFKGNFISPSGFMIRADTYRQMGGFNPKWRVAEDTEFFHRLAASHDAGLLMTSLFRWRVLPVKGLVSRGNVMALIENGIRSLDGALELRGEPSDQVKRLHREAIIREHQNLAYARLTELDPYGARRALQELCTRLPNARRSLRFRALRLGSLAPVWMLRAAVRGHGWITRRPWEQRDRHGG